MPMFEFKCTKCDNVFERFHSKDCDSDLCPKCGAESKKIMSTFMYAMIQKK
jgi:putative FmdB family regulatory protein